MEYSQPECLGGDQCVDFHVKLLITPRKRNLHFSHPQAKWKHSGALTQFKRKNFEIQTVSKVRAYSVVSNLY